jgi:hypothetical protein
MGPGRLPHLRRAITRAIYTVTVEPPHSPAGLIASGTVNGKAWLIGVDKPGTHGAGRGRPYMDTSGPAYTYWVPWSSRLRADGVGKRVDGAADGVRVPELLGIGPHLLATGIRR